MIRRLILSVVAALAFAGAASAQVTSTAPTSLSSGVYPRDVAARNIIRAAATAAAPAASALAPTYTALATGANSDLVTSATYGAPSILATSSKLTQVGGAQTSCGGAVPYCAVEGAGVRFWTDAPAFDFVRRTGSTAKQRLFVNGQYVNVGADSSTDTPGITDSAYHKYDFGSSALRLIEIRFTSAVRWGGINVASQYSVWPAPMADQPKILVIGDSYTAATGATYSLGGYARRMGERLGADVITAGYSGEGYTYPAAGNLEGKLAGLKALYPNLDMLVVAAGINDNGTAAATLQANVTSFYTTAKQLWPNALIVAVGPWRAPGRNPSQAISDAVKNGFAAVADAYRMKFIDTYAENWQNGTGRVGATNGSGNSDFYISSDNLHPSQAGHDYLGTRLAQEILDWLKTLVPGVAANDNAPPWEQERRAA